MTLLSIIVPIYEVHAYLRGCLDSILDQPFRDIEVIAVNDGSPDTSAQLLTEYAARDTRVRVIDLPRDDKTGGTSRSGVVSTGRSGAGRARDTGLARATGEYVWFVNGDDALAPGSLTAIARRLRAAETDLLLTRPARIRWDGAVTSTAATSTAGGAALDGWLQTMVIRRRHLRDLDLPFGTGCHDELAVTTALLALTTRITTLDQVCCQRRERRQAVRVPADRQFEIFHEGERAFAALDRATPDRAAPDRATPVTPQARARLFAQIIGAYLDVLDAPGRLTTRRPEFYQRVAAQYRRYRPADHRPAPGRAGRRHRLLDQGAFRRDQAHQHLARAGHQLRERVRTSIRAVGHGLVRVARAIAIMLARLYYRVQLLRPVDHSLAVFAAYWYRGYACNPAAIFEKARELVPNVRGVWIVRRADVASMPAGVSYVVSGTPAYYRALARAGWLVNNVNFPDFFVKRPGARYLQTHHGTPVKTMGLDQIAYPVGAQNTDFDKLLKRCDTWDFSLTANPHSSQTWDRVYPCGYRTWQLGYPRNDRLALATDGDTNPEMARIRQRLGLDPATTVILYLPTHREYQREFHPPLDAAELAAALGPGYTVLIRAHYFYRGSDEPTDARILDLTSYPCVEDLYLAADVLITDYSSAMFDYAVLDRPIVIYAPDWDAYRLTRGVTFDLLADPPGLVTRNLGDLVHALRHDLINAEPARRARAAFRDRFCPLDDGHAAERVVRRLFGIGDRAETGIEDVRRGRGHRDEPEPLQDRSTVV